MTKLSHKISKDEAQLLCAKSEHRRVWLSPIDCLNLNFYALFRQFILAYVGYVVTLYVVIFQTQKYCQDGGF